MNMAEKTQTTFSGISLLEFTLYLGIFLFLVSSSLYWVVNVCVPCISKSKQANSNAEIVSAVELFSRDIKCAPAEIKKWKYLGGTQLVWHTSKGDVGWSFSKEKLIRSIGSYDAQLQRWTKRVSSLATVHLKDVFFNTVLTRQEIKAVSLKGRFLCGGYQDVLKLEIAIRNGTMA